MIRKDRTANQKFFVNLQYIVFLVPLIAFPVLAESGTGIENHPTFIKEEEYPVGVSCINERNTNSNKIIEKEPDRSIYCNGGCNTKPENGGMKNFVSNKFMLDDSLLEPIFMFACILGTGKAVM